MYSVSRARLSHKTNSHWSHRCESKTFEVRIGVSLCMINREGESRKRWRRSQVRLIHGWLICAFYGQARNVVIQVGVKIGIDQEMKTPAKSMEHVICVTIWYARPALQMHIFKCSVNKFWRFENKSWLNIAIDIESDIWYHVSKQWDSAQPLERAGNKNEIYGQNKVSDMAVIGRHTRTLSQMWTSCINYLIFRSTSVQEKINQVKINQTSNL